MSPEAYTIYSGLKDHVHGLKLTKHFCDRYVERFGLDAKRLKSILKHIDKNICLMIYEAKVTEQPIKVNIMNARVVLKLIIDTEIHMQAVTVYKI